MSLSHEEALAERISDAIHDYNEDKKYDVDPDTVVRLMLDIMNDFVNPDPFIVVTVRVIITEDGIITTEVHE